MDWRAFVRNERTVGAAVGVLTAAVVVALACRLVGIDLSYDSSAPSATPGMTLVVALAVMVGSCSLLIVVERMFVAWKDNRAPDFWEKVFWLICLVAVPFGLIVYYWAVYKRMDGDGQYRLF